MSEEIGINGLSKSESEMIAECFIRDVPTGITGKGLEWKVEHGQIDESEKETIYELLNEGFTSGYYPKWELIFKRR